MTAAVRASTNSGGAASGTSAVVTKPTGTIDNDIVEVTLYIQSTAAITVPSGWTEKSVMALTTAGSEFKLYVYWKRASSEGASWTWSWTGSATYEWQCTSWHSAVTSGDPYNVVNTATRDNTTNDQLPAVACTTTVTNTAISWRGAHGPAGGSPDLGAHNTPTGGLTEIIDQSAYVSTCTGTQASAGAFSASAATFNAPSNSTAAAWIGAIIEATPVYTQLHGRFRNDDGSETAATWIAAEDVNITQSSGTNTRLRIQVDTSAADPPSATFQLEYKKSSDSLWRKVESAGGGTIASGTAGTVGAGGTTSVTVAYPAVAAGDCILMVVVNRPSSQTPATPSGWDQVNTHTGGAGSEGADTGTIRCTVFVKKNADGRYEATGSESGSETVTCTSGTSMFGRMFKYSKTTGKAWEVRTTQATDNTAGTDYQCTMPTDPGFVDPAVGDMVIAAIANSVDTARAASHAFNASGATFGTVTELQDSGITTGNDLGMVVFDAAVATTTGAGNITVSATFSGTNSASSAGPTVLVTLRQADQPIQLSASANITASGEATTAQLTAPASGTFTAGRIQDDENPADAIDIGLDGYTELEWCLIATSQAPNGTAYQFRVTRSGTALDTYTVTPQWTVGTPFTAAGAATIGAITASGSATFAPGTKTASAAVTITAVTASGSATFTSTNLYTASAAITITPVAASGAAAFSPGTKTAAGAASVAPVTASGSAAFSAGTKTADGAATVAPITMAASATFEDFFRAAGAVTTAAVIASGAATFAPGTKTASASITVAAIAAAGNATFAAGTKTATAGITIAPVVAAGTAVFSEGLRIATGAVTIGPATVAATATFSPGTKTAAGVVTIGPVSVAAAAAFTPGTKTAAGSVTIGAASAAGVAAFSAGVKTATGAVTVAAPTAAAAATFTVPVYSAVGAVTIGAITMGGAGTTAQIPTDLYFPPVYGWSGSTPSVVGAVNATPLPIYGLANAPTPKLYGR